MMFWGWVCGFVFAAAIISTIYWVNRGIRRDIKRSGDDARVENHLTAGHTLHGEGVIGRRHPEVGGNHLRQEESNPISTGRS